MFEMAEYFSDPSAFTRVGEARKIALAAFLRKK